MRQLYLSPYDLVSCSMFSFFLFFSNLFRLAAIFFFNQDQHRTENTLSSNRQSDLEREYIHAFKDGKRLDAIEVIAKKFASKNTRAAPQDTLDHVKASRLACLIFEV